MQPTYSIYLLPPIFSLIGGLCLASLALARRGGGKEKVYFALVCIWYSLLSPIFISHHLIDDPQQILSIERGVHFFYVYLPFIQVLFFHHILQIRQRTFIAVLFGISFLLSLTTQTDYYFHGLHHFSWGYIAKGGISFQIFSIYGAGILVYCACCFIRRLKSETNPVLRLKFRYMLFSFGLIALMTFMNIPAIQGKNIYPAGNFIFLPMTILAYGVLKHRLLEMRSLLHITLIRLLLSLAIVAPNVLLFAWYEPRAASLSGELQFVVLALWFCCNYLIIQSVHTSVDRLLNRPRYTLKLNQNQLIGELMVLRDTDELARKLKDTICNILPFACAQIYVFDEKLGRLVGPEKNTALVTPSLTRYLAKCSRTIEKQSLLPHTASQRAALERLLTDLNAGIAVPLVHEDLFVGVLTLPEKRDGRTLNPDEAMFLNNISKPLALALSNAVMYQRISALKDRLQANTDALTQEIEERLRTEHDLHAAQGELKDANMALEHAILQANEMTCRLEISNHELVREMEDRQRADAALRQSEATYSLIAENSTDVIWTIDLKGHFTFISPSVFYLLDYTSDEMMGTHTSAVLTPESQKLVLNVISEELARARKPDGIRRKSRAIQLEQLRKDGATVWTEVNTRFIADKKQQIIGILGVTRDITESKKSEQDLIYMANFDALTGLNNRKAFLELLDAEIKYAQRYQSGLSLIFFDLNKFKLVNDTYGHQVGDKLLKSVADRLKKVIRETDIVARIGGDEFTLILKNPDKVSPDGIARRIVRDLSKPFELEGACIDFVTASMGIATFPRDGTTSEVLMKNADLAMYDAKKNSAEWIHFNELTKEEP